MTKYNATQRDTIYIIEHIINAILIWGFSFGFIKTGDTNNIAPAIIKKYENNGVIEINSLMKIELIIAPIRYNIDPVNNRIETILNSSLDFIENHNKIIKNVVALKI